MESVEDDPFIEAHFASMKSMNSTDGKKKKGDSGVNLGYLSQGIGHWKKTRKNEFREHRQRRFRATLRCLGAPLFRQKHAQECEKSTSGWRELLKNVFAKDPL